jgi:twinkle protein
MNRKPTFRSAVTRDELRKVDDLRKPLWWLYQTGIPRGESTGWVSLDPYYTVRPREWTLITGIPGHGKTAFLDGLMVNLAKEKGWRWAVFSAENLPHERHAADLAAQYIGRPFGTGIRQRLSQEELTWATMFLEDHFVWLAPPEDDCTVDRLLMLADMLSSEPWGLQGLVIDPWNEVDHSRPSTMSETEYISQQLSKIRRFAREHETHVFIVAHPTKMIPLKSDDPNVRIYPVPTPYDVQGSSHWRAKADNCICVWRDVKDPDYGCDVHIQKIRFREIGQVGAEHMGYDRATNMLIDRISGPVKPFAPKDAERQRDARMEGAFQKLEREIEQYMADEPLGEKF